MMTNFESLRYFAPEFVQILAILLVLVISLRKKECKTKTALLVTVFGLVIAIVLTIATHIPSDIKPLFMGMISIDSFGRFFKLIILGTALVTVLMTEHSKELNSPSKTEFYSFLLAVTLGLSLLSVANNLLMIYLALEISSIVAYLMSGYLPFNKRSEEASLKYVLYGGMASGIMIYGMSLLYGLTGSLSLSEIQYFLLHNATDRIVLFITFIFILAGLGYKMAIAPFHMWSPDVYEGAPLPVTAYLSVASKAGGFAVTVRFFLVAFSQKEQDVWEPLKSLDWQTLVAVLSALTMTVGNLIALQQSNMKRFLAYSSIAHAGYLLMGLASQNVRGVEAINFYFIIYFLMNLGAFLIVTLVANQLGTENIEDYRGLAKRSLYGLLLSLSLAVFMFSLVGLPPFAGFIAKWYLFQAVLDAKLYWLAIVAVINSVISLFYYARIVKYCLIESPQSETTVQNMSLRFSLVIAFFAVLTLYFGVFFEPLTKWAENSTQFIF